MMLFYERLAFFFFKGPVFKSRLYMDLNFESLMADAQDAQELPSLMLSFLLWEGKCLYDVL
jgi:hypothetical protein